MYCTARCGETELPREIPGIVDVVLGCDRCAELKFSPVLCIWLPQSILEVEGRC